jgi:hypothetical protein
MDQHQVRAGNEPHDPHGIAGSRRSLAHRPVTVWAATVAVFAALHAAVLVGASYWRYGDAQRAWPQTRAVLAQWDVHAASVTDIPGRWGGEWTDIPAPALDLDSGAVITQVLASTAAFALLLGAAMVLAVHGHRALARFGALIPAVSVAAMGGILARIAPMVPVPGSTPIDQLNLDMWPAALRDDRIALDRAMATTDTPIWWNALLAVLVAVVALVGVRQVLRVGRETAATVGRPAPWRVGATIGVLSVAMSVALAGDGSVPVNLAVVTGLTAFLLAAAAACTSAFVVTVMTLGVVATHWALLSAFDRAGGAPGGWSIGTSGAQSSWTLGTAVALLLAPVAGWATAELWSRAVRHSASRSAQTAEGRSTGGFSVPEPSR